MSEETPREDPRMSKGSSGQHGGLCLRGHQGRIPGCARDPPDRISCPRVHVCKGSSGQDLTSNALLGGGVRVRVWIREQRKIKRRSKTLLSL